MWQTIRREELYEQVWSVPIVRFAERYGLSDNGLRKVCMRLNVPLPPRGYWARIAAGQRVRRPVLPKESKRTYAEIRATPKSVSPVGSRRWKDQSCER
jgi:hypothetical protein